MIQLKDTNGGRVAATIAEERHRLGSSATGMVMNLLVLTDEEHQADAIAAASIASREHPMRTVVLVPRARTRLDTRLDAEISVGGDQGPGEIITLRLRGELADHGDSVAIPLLLPDTPVVAWWPAAAPDVPRDSPIGRHAQRRITDTTRATRQLAALRDRARTYCPGDTDLAWTSITRWRSLLAAMLDQPHGRIIGAEVRVPKSHAAGHLLAAWLGSRLGVPASVVPGRGPGINNVTLHGTAGKITLSRDRSGNARLSRPGFPPARIKLPRRSRGDLMAEELRRLDPDVVYGETLGHLSAIEVGRLPEETLSPGGGESGPGAGP